MEIDQQTLWGRWPSIKRGKEDAKNNEIETNESMDKNKTAIVNLIVKCSKEATKKPEKSQFAKSLTELVTKLKEVFKSEYCAIGTIDEKYAIDRACTLKGLPKDVKRAPIKSESYLVCQSLSQIEKGPIFYYGKDDLMTAQNYPKYQKLLNKDPENTTIIIIQDDDGVPQGYIQFLNSESKIEETDFNIYKTELFWLTIIVKQWCALEEEKLFLKDFEFINEISENANNVDKLLFDIMKYLADEFNAGIISYRIPLLVGTNKQPIFYLRDCYVSNKIDNDKNIKDFYNKNRLVVTKNEMGGVEKLICKNHYLPVILAEPNISVGKMGVSQDIVFKKDAILIPIIRDHSGKDVCTNNEREKKDSLCNDGWNCSARFEKYFGLFRLRILKNKDEGEDDNVPEEVIKRLHNLAKHISVLLNAIVDKDENESLKAFQTGLYDFSFTDFTKNGEFEMQCAKIIKKSTEAEACTIYKYDKLSDEMTRNVSTSKNNIIQIDYDGEKDELFFDSNLKKTIQNCRKWFPLEENITDQVFVNNEPLYYVGKKNVQKSSMMLVPMMKKDGTRIGMILLIGKETKNLNASNTYWEQDKKCIKFMVDILSRIEESDADRLIFLLQLSHELRKPITEIVYKNDFLLSTADRNKDSMSQNELLKGLIYNMNSCMMFKQIITDIETSYYMRKGSVSYNFKDENVKSCLLDVIRLFEQGGGLSEKSLVLKTQISQMPQTMYVDKEKIKQVFVNLLKNAIQYSDKYSTITISYSFNKKIDCHEINFQNFGIGVEREERFNIFELWKRGVAAKKKRPNGTGMGLSIVKEIVEAHGGECFVKRMNNPTIFTVRIPGLQD